MMPTQQLSLLRHVRVRLQIVFGIFKHIYIGIVIHPLPPPPTTCPILIILSQLPLYVYQVMHATFLFFDVYKNQKVRWLHEWLK